MEVLVFIGFVVAAIAVALYLWQQKMKRRHDIGTFALANGLRFSPGDPFDLPSLPFRLFDRGDGRGAENVMWGTWGGHELTAFDYWYYEESTSSDGGSSRSYRHFSCVILTVPAHLPDLQVTREGLASRLADRVGLPDLNFESEDFNRRFEIRSSVRRFAYEFVDARMIAWLLAVSGKYGFETAGLQVLFFGPRHRPTELVTLLGAAVSFRKRIPNVVWGLYGAGAAAAGQSRA